MRRLSFAVLVLAGALAPAAAIQTEVFPGKVRINSTAADALCVGSSGGAAPTCTGGISSGAIAGSTISASTGFRISGAAGAGTFLRGNGTNYIASVLTLPNAANAGDVLIASGANAIGAQAPAALTRTDDTNVTATLGGAASTALVNAASITLGWTGTLAPVRGGMGLDTSGSTGVAQVSAGTWSVTTTLQNAVQDNITRLGTVTTGTFPAGNLSGTTLAAGVVTASLTTVGILDAGSITSGFGSIDVGADAITGGALTGTTINATTGFRIAGAAAAGVFLRGNGTNFVASTLTLPNTLAATRVLYGTGTDAAGASSGLVFDGTNLGIGLAVSPTELIHINGATKAGMRITIANVFKGFYGIDDGTYYTTAPAGDFIIAAGGNVRLGGSSSTGEVLYLETTKKIAALGTLAAPSTGSFGFVFGDGTALASLASNTAALYADDVNGTVNMFAINENGDVARLSGLTARNASQFDKAASTVLADVTGLSLGTQAGKAYEFAAKAYVTASAAGGVKFAMSGTTTATSTIYVVRCLDEATNTYAIVSTQTALAGSVAASGPTSMYCTIDGTIVVNAAGNLTVQFAQFSASGTSSVRANSTFELRQIP